MTETIGAAYVAVYQSICDAAWPLDHGDDPSFGASLELGGPLTWGICRSDLRNQVREGDLIVFVATDRLADRRPARYRLSGWGTVERRVSHTDVWLQDDLVPFRAYSNLLLRPRSGSADFEHFESSQPWHADWLWRLAPKVGYLKKAAFNAAGAASSLLPEGKISVGGSRLNPSKSYVIFAAEGAGTTVLLEPPVIALAHSNGRVESWERTELTDRLRPMLLDGTGRLGLRTTNKHQAHRHIKSMKSAVELRSLLEGLARSSGLELRRRVGAERTARFPA